ncbi:hypothetical protein [Luteipulveratus halotolerans]|uniref:Uncharacterized protein n=1 Tax=Luteipulveratus halotolerans TaxID=1631356 RepID=A0A0L6CJV0_9MICO|nr:hypothetical protein [Luteipulveratus halotolerans]KNX38071.1 hypothetical protein VV01_14435 [Luteipulveratus halotolerans]
MNDHDMHHTITAHVLNETALHRQSLAELHRDKGIAKALRILNGRGSDARRNRRALAVLRKADRAALAYDPMPADLPDRVLATLRAEVAA